MLQNATLSGNQRHDLLTSLINMSLVQRLPCEIHFCRSSSNVPHLPSFLEMLQNPHVFPHFCQGAQSLAPATRKHIWTSKNAPYPTVFLHFWLRNVLRATTACTFSTSQLPKVLWTRQFFALLRSKCASRHNGVHYFDISTSKSSLSPSVLITLLTQRRALFRYLNFQKCSEPVSRQSCTLLTSKYASRHKSPEPQIIGKTVVRDFPTFSDLFGHLDLLCSETFSFWSSFFFSSLLFFDSYHLCFSSIHIVRNLTSRLPSIINLLDLIGP